MEYYTQEQLSTFTKYADSLPEKARRHFLAVQYQQLGKGSQRYLADVFSCSRITITKGVRELAEVSVQTLDYSRQRKAGGGRKKKSTNN